MSKHYKTLHAAAMQNKYSGLRRQMEVDITSAIIGKKTICEDSPTLEKVKTLTDSEMEALHQDIFDGGKNGHDLTGLTKIAQWHSHEVASAVGQAAGLPKDAIITPVAEETDCSIEEARRRKAVAEAAMAELELAERTADTDITLSIGDKHFSFRMSKSAAAELAREIRSA